MTATTRTNTPAKPQPTTATIYGEPRFHTDAEIAALRYAADGTLYSVDDAGVLRHWSADGKLLKRTYLSDLETVWVFSPDGTFLASGNDDLIIWNVADGSLQERLPQPSWVTALAFSPDGRTIASGHDDGAVRFHDTASAQGLGGIKAHTRPVSAVSFAPAGDRLASAGEDRVVRVWDAMSHAKLNELTSHTDRIPSLAWKPDGTLLVSAGWDTSARVWAPAHADPLMLLNSHSDQVMSVAYSPSGHLLAAADSDNDIYLWSDATTAKVHKKLSGHLEEIRVLAFSPDGTRLASGGADRVIHIWDTATGSLIAGPNPTSRNQVCVVRHNDKTYLASAGGNLFHFWDADTAQEVWPSGDGTAQCVAAQGTWLAVGGTDHTTRLYDLSQPNSEPRKLEATKPPIGGLTFAPDGSLLGQASPKDGLVWLWDPKSDGDAKLILVEAADGCTLESVAFLPDCDRIAVGGIDVFSTGERTGAVCIWDLNTKLKDMIFDVGVNEIAVDPKGRYLAGAGLNENVLVWDLTTNELVFELDGHVERINAVAFSPDGSYLASAADDHTVRMWDVLSGRLLVVREFDTAVQSLAFSGGYLYLGHANTTCSRVDVKNFLD